MPYAPPTPQDADSLNFRGFSDALPVMPTTGVQPQLVFPSQIPPSQPSHPLLDIQITDYIKFQVNSTGANFSKWRHISSWSAASQVLLDGPHCLLGCGLGRLPGYTEVHFRFLCFPWCQSCFMVLSLANHRFSVQCGGGVPGCGKLHCGFLLDSPATAGAPSSTLTCHGGLL
jgi:hypothetical protein